MKIGTEPNEPLKCTFMGIPALCMERYTPDTPHYEVRISRFDIPKGHIILEGIEDRAWFELTLFAAEDDENLEILS